MRIGWPDQEVQWQAGTATEQGMHPIAAQEGTRMVSRSVTKGSIGIGSAPREDGSTINNQIAGSDQTRAHGLPDREHEECLKERSSCRLPAFAQLGRAGNARLTIASKWQAAG